MKNTISTIKGIICTTSMLSLSLTTLYAQSESLPQNLSFEEGSGGTATSWLSSGFWTERKNGSQNPAHEGSFSMVVYPNSSVRQSVTAASGEEWHLSGYLMNFSGGQIAEGDYAFLQIEFAGPSGSLGLVESAHLGYDTPVDGWQTLSVTGTAPVDTTTVTFRAVLAQGGTYQGGQAVFDDFSVTKTAAPGAVPEPSSVALVGLGTIAFWLWLGKNRR